MRLVVEADGASRGNPGAAAIGVVVLDALGNVVREIARYLGDHLTNNVAEWHGLVAGLEEAQRLGATDVDVRMDSELVVHQLRGTYRVKDAKLLPLAARARELRDGFAHVRVEHVPRERNVRADALANRALDKQGRSSNPGVARSRPR